MPASPFDLAGSLALITGSSRGLGLGMARALAGAGAAVVLNARDAEALKVAAEALSAEGHTVHTAAFDVTDHAAASEAVSRIETEIGAIGILFNNAGVNIRGPLADMGVADWSTVLATNLDSVFHVSQAVGQGMIARGRGKIVNTCSLMSRVARAGVAPYAASKGGAMMLTKAMAVEWAAHNIQVNGIAPGYIRTELTEPLVRDAAFSQWVLSRTPAGRWGEPADLAGAVVFLASPASDFVTGHILYVDGGFTAQA